MTGIILCVIRQSETNTNVLGHFYLIDDFIILKGNTISEVEGPEAWEVEMDVLEGEEVPSLEVVEVPNLEEEASRTRAALLRVVEAASRALEVFLP